MEQLLEKYRKAIANSIYLAEPGFNGYDDAAKKCFDITMEYIKQLEEPPVEKQSSSKELTLSKFKEIINKDENGELAEWFKSHNNKK